MKKHGYCLCQYGCAFAYTQLSDGYIFYKSIEGRSIGVIQK